MTDTATLDNEHATPDLLEAIARAQGAVDAAAFDPAIRNLVRLRASQLNRCGFCVKMHVREALEAGETPERLHRLVVWDQLRDFDEREKAALAWTEALTLLDHHTDFNALRGHLSSLFSEQEIGVLTANIAMINLWNRINVAKH